MNEFMNELLPTDLQLFLKTHIFSSFSRDIWLLVRSVTCPAPERLSVWGPGLGRSPPAPCPPHSYHRAASSAAANHEEVLVPLPFRLFTNRAWKAPIRQLPLRLIGSAATLPAPSLASSAHCTVGLVVYKRVGAGRTSEVTDARLELERTESGFSRPTLGGWSPIFLAAPRAAQDACLPAACKENSAPIIQYLLIF